MTANQAGGLETCGEAAEQDLDPRASLVVADQPVPQSQRPAVQCAGRTDADVGEPGPAQVLDHGERSGGEGAHSSRRLHETHRRAGGEEGGMLGGRGIGFQSTASVVPISCHPPGLERG